MDALTISVILLWAAVIVLAVLLWALTRQVGILFERVAPMGALVTDAGPSLGSASPVMALRDLMTRPVSIGQALPTGQQAQLIFFLSPTCPVCKKLLPVLKALSRDERQVQVVLASDGESAEHLEFIQTYQLQALPYVLSKDLGMAYRVSKLPYAVLLAANGTVLAKGLVNSREQLDSLLNVLVYGKSSIQQYLEPGTSG